MKNLIIKGIKNIDGMKFHDIEGGFGEGKKAMLVKEIADIHSRPFGKINELINKNINRFKDGIDIIDLKGTDFVILLKDNEIYTQNSINRSSNIYLLSERGYAKLLKILEDDLAWEQYDKLVDEYFNTRAELKEIKLDSYMIEDPIKRAEKWLEEQRAKQVLLQNLVVQKGIIEEYKPKVEAYDSFIDSNGLIKVSAIAQDYGMTAIELNKLLYKLGIQYKKGDQWFLYAKYKDMGYTKSDYTEIPHRDGTISIKATTKWTPKGILFIDEILRGIGISSVSVKTNEVYQQIAF